MPLITVIIPVFNYEKYITAAVQSVLTQPLKDIEIIIINDGSTDKTSEIAHTYADKYENIHVIDQTNQGVSVARNVGISTAKGKYLLFLDADDRLVSESLDRSVEQYCQKDYDVIMFSSYLSNVKRNRYRVELQMGEAELGGKKIFSQAGHFGANLYRKEMLRENQIKFDGGVRLSEDLAFKMKSLYVAKKIRTTGKFLYIYSSTPESVTHTLRDKFDCYFAWQKTREWFISHEYSYQENMHLYQYLELMMNSRMLLYAKSYVQMGHGKKALFEELNRVDGYELLMRLNAAQVMPYQKEELQWFQKDLKKFFMHARKERWKLDFGRMLVKIPVIGEWRDNKRYPITEI